MLLRLDRPMAAEIGDRLYVGEDYGSGGDVILYTGFPGAPEPATLGLMSLGAVAIIRRRRR